MRNAELDLFLARGLSSRIAHCVFRSPDSFPHEVACFRKMRDRAVALRRRGLTHAVPVLLLAALLLGLSSLADLQAASPVLAVKAAKVYVGDGSVVEPGVVLIQDGRITDIGTELAVPDGATILDMGQASVTPGLIDANARIGSTNLIAPSRKGPTRDALKGGMAEGVASVEEERQVDADPASAADPTHTHAASDRGLPWHVGEEFPDADDAPAAMGIRPTEMVNEQSSEVVPHTNVLDSLNFDSDDFHRLVRGGVTTVYASPDASAVIAARGAVVHTAGPVDKRVLVAAAAVKATVGSEPSYFGSRNTTPSRNAVTMFARRPNSRMGLVWVFRKAFYDARRRQQGETAYGADTAGPEATAVLMDVLDGKTPLRIQARIQRDILTALRLTDEFGLRFTLEEATEAYLCIDELKARQVPVIFGPIYESATGRRSRGDVARARYFTFRALLAAGIPTALSAQEYREEEGLARQAMYAVRFGVTFDDALRCVTQWPAQMLGLDSEMGTLETGKRADLVVWSEQPLAATSRIVAVMVDGEMVVDGR